MPYLQEMLVDECIEELERKEKRSEDFRNSLEFLKNSPFHSLFPFPGLSPDRYARDIGSFDNFLLLNGDTSFFIYPIVPITVIVPITIETFVYRLA